MAKNKAVAIVVGIVVVAGLVAYTRGIDSTQVGNNLPGSNAPGGQQGSVPAAGGAGAASGGSTGGQAPSGPKTFTSQAYGITLQYPASLSTETSIQASGFATQEAVGVIALFTRMGTVVNRLTVSVSSEPADVGACTNAPGSKSTATIGGVIFTKYQLSASKDGQDTNTTVYRVLRDRTCYELREVITSSELADLTAPEIETQRANIAASSALMDSVIQSVRFTY